MSNIQLSSYAKSLIVKLRCALYSIKYDYLTKHYGKESNSQGSLINLTKKLRQRMLAEVEGSVQLTFSLSQLRESSIITEATTISHMSNIQLSSYAKFLIVKLRCTLYSIKYGYLTKHYSKESNTQGSLINLTKN